MNSNMFHQRARDCLRLRPSVPICTARSVDGARDEFSRWPGSSRRIHARAPAHNPDGARREDAATYRQPAVR